MAQEDQRTEDKGLIKAISSSESGLIFLMHTTGQGIYKEMLVNMPYDVTFGIERLGMSEDKRKIPIFEVRTLLATYSGKGASADDFARAKAQVSGQGVVVDIRPIQKTVLKDTYYEIR